MERTYLFVPGDRPDRFDKALASGADIVVLDLEDAVPPGAKSIGRDNIAAWFDRAAPTDRERIAVRINGYTSSWFTDDMSCVSSIGTWHVMLSKVEEADQIAAVRAATPKAAVLALVESARGIAQIEKIAAAEGVSRVAFGTLDFALDLDLEVETDPSGLSYAASRIAIASRLAGLPTPIAGVTTEIADDRRLIADMAWARRYGFGAKLCIHPRQIAVLHALLHPSKGELDWARRVLAAASCGSGAVQVDGRMVDRPVLERARALLDRAQRQADDPDAPAKT